MGHGGSGVAEAHNMGPGDGSSSSSSSSGGGGGTSRSAGGRRADDTDGDIVRFIFLFLF